MPHSVHKTATDKQTNNFELSQLYWNQNIPPEEWTKECPPYLTNTSEKNIGILSSSNEDAVYMDWPAAQDLIRRNRIDLFHRTPLELRRYMKYVYELKQEYGSVLAFIQRERLGWIDITPSNDRHFENSSDLKILYNDWPYALNPDIVHLIVWTKFPLEEDEVTDDLTIEGRREIEDFVTRTFCGEGGIPRDQVIWFKNWKSLKSVHALEHFHVMLYQAPVAFLERITGGDKPMSVVLAETETR